MRITHNKRTFLCPYVLHKRRMCLLRILVYVRAYIDMLLVHARVCVARVHKRVIDLIIRTVA